MEFVFGAAVAFFAIAIVGPFFGIVVGLFAAIETVSIWGHSFGYINLALESLAVGLAYLWIHRPNLLYLTAAYWAFLGAPIAWGLYSIGFDLGEKSVEVLMLNHAINGVVNAGIAEFLLSVVVYLRGRGIRIPVYDAQKLERSFAEGVSNLIVGFVLLALISEAAIFSRTRVTEIIAELGSKAQLFYNVAYPPSVAALAPASDEPGERLAELQERLAQAAGRTGIEGLEVSVVVDGSSPVAESRDARPQYEHYSVAGAHGHADLPAGPQTSMLERLRKGAWVRDFRPPRVDGVERHLVRVAVPLAASIARLQVAILDRYMMISAILAACFVLVPVLTRRFIRPLAELASISHNLISGKGDGTKIDWPRSRYVELEGIWVNLNALFRNLRDVRREEHAARIRLETIAHELTQLIDTANAPIFGIDAEGRVNEWNQTMERITGFSKSETFGRDLVEDFITDEYRHSVRRVLEKALLGEEASNYEFPIYTKAGNRVDVLLNSTTRRDSSGRIIGVVGVGQDITEVNKSRAELETIANELTQLIDTANAPIFGIDSGGRITEWNQTAARITGYTKSEVMGRDLVEGFITEDYKSSVRDVLEKALLGTETANFEFPLYTKRGDRVDVLLNSTTRRDANGDIVGVVGVGQDITEVKHSQQQVIHASKLATLGEMATAVAHELNQPLNVIRMAIGNCQMRIEAGSLTPEYIDEKLTRINEQVSRAAAIIDHMRMFGRKTPEEATVFDVRDAIASTQDLIGEQLRLAGIHVKNDLGDEPLPVRGHPLLLEQTLLNLFTNARDAIAAAEGRAGRLIAVRAFREDDRATIEVEDWGGGVPETIVGRIFEPFFTTKEMGKGTGLGLSVSYGIIRDMNGHISVRNTGSGALFSISIPIAGEDGSSSLG